MKSYFSLQLKMLARHLRGKLINPWLAAVLAPVIFVGISRYIFEQVAYAEYLYFALALSLIVKPAEAQRNDFLKSIFSAQHYRLIRIGENALLVLPFCAFLLYQLMWELGLLLLILSTSAAIFSLRSKMKFCIPTPFGKRPFEFSVGFRQSFLLFPLTWFLVFMAVSVGNLNLGIGAMMLCFVICMYYYTNPEKEFYVWIFAASPKEFLQEKIKTAVLFSFLLSLPVAVALGVFFTKDLDIILLFLLLGELYLLGVILAKYSAFPEKMNLSHGILIGMSIWFPPLLLAVIPWFYKQALNKLKPILQ